MLNTYKLLNLTKLLLLFSICICCLTTNAQTVTCPSNLDLGLFDCNTIDDVPTQVNSLEDATSVYGIEISGALDETGVTTMDSDIVFYCESDAREVTREVIVYNDGNFNFQYDAGEEVSICTFTISTEADTTAPVFTAPGDFETTCAMGTDPEITGFPDLMPNDGCPDLTVDNVNKSDAPPTTGSCAGEKIFVRSWTATDPCGNANEPQTQTITILDETGPDFTVPDDITVPCGTDPGDVAVTGDVTDGYDECEDTDVTVQGRIVDDLTQEDTQDTPCPGFTTFTKIWGAVDGCGNATTKEQLIIVECPADCSNDDICIGDRVTDPLPGECECQVVEEQVLGCTDAEADNYNPDANCDDDSCEFGVFDLALMKVLSSSGPFLPGGDVTFTITVFNQGTEVAQNIEITDYTPTGLTLNDSDWADQGNGTATATIAGPLNPGDSESIDITFTIPADATNGSYENFAEISAAQDEDGNPGEDIDSTPDNDPDNDNYTDDVTDNSNDDEDDHDGAVFEIACIDGCTDSAACNYNPAATCDDDSCMAVPTCNDDPCAGDITILSADGCSCEPDTPQLLGCTDPAACNYDANANCDDGSCQPVPTCNDDPCAGDVTTISADGCSCEVVTPQVLGCTDASSCNYNSAANCDDGSCLPVPECNTNPCRGDVTKLEGCDCVVVEAQALGCNDPLADNYDANANCNDGSCTYPSPCPPKMRVCTAPQTPIEICLPCILSGELDAEVTDVNTLFAQCEIDDLDDENVACFTYTPLPLAASPSEIEVTWCRNY